MARDWARLGERLKAGRIERGMEQQEVASAIGVKRGAIRNIEIGQVVKITTTIRMYAKLIGWADGSIDDVLDGGEPTVDTRPKEADSTAAVTAGAAESDLSLHVQQSLRRGPLLESRVEEVKTPAGRVVATIVIRGEDGLTQEELLAALQALTVEISTKGDARPSE